MFLSWLSEQRQGYTRTPLPQSGPLPQCTETRIRLLDDFQHEEERNNVISIIKRVSCTALTVTGIVAIAMVVWRTLQPPLITYEDKLPEGEAPAVFGPLQPALADLEFPVEVISYPSNWPSVLNLPSNFQPVELNEYVTSSTRLRVRTGLFRYDGAAAQAADELGAFFGSGDWRIVEQSLTEQGDVALLVAPASGNGSGVIVISPMSDDVTHLLFTISLES